MNDPIETSVMTLRTAAIVVGMAIGCGMLWQTAVGQIANHTARLDQMEHTLQAICERLDCRQNGLHP